ncbi:MAG: PaaI family thioesterase [Proteobacteria bacterium]|nr:PaaI family thioesterase [Pseudomonadota bacterium]
MDEKIRAALYAAMKRERYSSLLGLELKDLDLGYALVEMTYDPERINNLFDQAHGGAIFGLLDEAFQLAGQTHGTMALALNVNVTYTASPDPGSRLRAEAREVSRSNRTASYDIKVTDQDGRLIAVCQALAYRTGKPLPFL